MTKAFVNFSVTCNHLVPTRSALAVLPNQNDPQGAVKCFLRKYFVNTVPLPCSINDSILLYLTWFLYFFKFISLYYGGEFTEGVAI